MISLRQMAYPDNYFEMAKTPQAHHKLVVCNMYTAQVLIEGWMRQCQGVATYFSKPILLLQRKYNQ